MAETKYYLTQTGEQVQEILDNAPETQEAVEQLQEDLTAETERAENVEQGLDNRLATVEELAQISVDGGTIQIGTAADFVNPSAEQRAKIPTVGAAYDALIPNKVIPTETDITIEPNKFYKFGEVSALTITLGEEVEGKENEYKFQFTSPADGATVLTMPDNLTWLNDDALEPEEGMIYEVSIMENLAVYAECEAAES